MSKHTLASASLEALVHSPPFPGSLSVPVTWSQLGGLQGSTGPMGEQTGLPAQLLVALGEVT